MSNSKALVYLSTIKIKGFIRNLIRKPMRLIFTIIGALLFIALFWFVATRGSIIPATIIDSLAFMLIVGAMGLLLLLTLSFNKQSALLHLNDANYLFGGPFTVTQVKHYIVWQNFVQLLLLSAGALGYVLIFLNFFIIDVSYLWKSFILLALSLFFVLMYFNYYYIKNASLPKRTKEVYWFAILSIAAIGLFVLSYFIQADGFVLEELFIAIADSNWFEFIPFLGWAMAIQKGNWLIGFGIPLLLGILYTFLFYQFDGEFYEKSIEDAERISKVLETTKKGGGQQDQLDSMKDSKKLVRLDNYPFLGGEWAIFSRQLLQLIKTKNLLSLTQLILFGIYAIMGIASQEAEFYMIMVAISILFSAVTEDIENELNRPFIYLIPGSSFKKLLSTMGVTVIRTFIMLCLSVLVLTIGLSTPLSEAIPFAITIFSGALIYLAISVLSMRLIGLKANQFILTLVRLLVFFIAAIPIVVVGLVMVFMLEMPIESIAGVAFLTNFILSLLILYLARGVVEGQGLVD